MALGTSNHKLQLSPHITFTLLTSMDAVDIRCDSEWVK